MVKHLLLILTFIFGCAFTAFPHDKDEKKGEDMRKELREFKVKFIAQEIGLREDQKDRFVELYNEMNDKRMAAMHDAWKMSMDLRKKENATEADYQAVTDAMTKARTEDAAIEQSYDEKFSKFLTQKQIYKMKEAENEFRKKMSEMRHKHGKKGGKEKH